MDAATLYMIVTFPNGQTRKWPPQEFPSVAECEKHVAKMNRIKPAGAVIAYECMRWYAIAK